MGCKENNDNCCAGLHYWGDKTNSCCSRSSPRSQTHTHILSFLSPGKMCKDWVKEMVVNIKCKNGRGGGCMLNSSGLYQANQLPRRKNEKMWSGLRHLALRFKIQPPYLSVCPHTTLSQQLRALHNEPSQSVFLPVCLPLLFFIC